MLPSARVGIRPLTFQVRILFVFSFCILATKSHSTKAKQKATAAKQQLLAKAGKSAVSREDFLFSYRCPPGYTGRISRGHGVLWFRLVLSYIICVIACCLLSCRAIGQTPGLGHWPMGRVTPILEN